MCTQTSEHTIHTQICGGIQINLRDLLHHNGNQQSLLLPFFPKFSVFTCFGNRRKLSAPTYLKYSAYRGNLTALNHSWNFYHVIAKGTDKQKKTFNKYYLNSAQCKTFRKTMLPIIWGIVLESLNFPQVMYFSILFLSCNESIGY